MMIIDESPDRIIIGSTDLPRPSSYYSFAGGINWKHVAAQLLLQETSAAGWTCHKCFFYKVVG